MLRFFRRKRWDQERIRELESYIAEETADNIARGMDPEQAVIAARRKLGNPALIREEIYQMNSIGWFETLWHDLRYAFRVLRKSPGFTVVALLSLALGIGATTAIFSVIYGVLISPYPYAKPNEIWAPSIRNLQNAGQSRGFHHSKEILDISQLPAVQSWMATSPTNQSLTGEHSPENFQAVLLSANALNFLGVPAALGRTIQPSDIRPDGEPERVIVLSHGAWQRLFGGRPDALGKKLVLNDEHYTVIGVMPPRFGWWTNEGGWVPMSVNPREDRMAATIIRLKPGITKQVALEQVRGVHERWSKIKPEDYPKTGFATVLDNYLDITAASGEMQSSLRLLFGAVALLLLIACANVANLQLARATARAHEIAVRMSIGAARGRVFRQLLTESVLLSVLGGILGIILAIGITKAIVVLMPSFYVPNEARITVNTYVLFFSSAVSILSGVLFGLSPALKASRPDLVEALKDAGRMTGATSAGGGTRNGLVIASVALSVVMLIAAGLTIRGFLKLQAINLGFQPDRVLMVGVQLAPKRYTTYDQRTQFNQNLLASLETIPGAQSVAMGNGGLPFGGPQSPFTIEGRESIDSRPITVGLISAGYSRALGIPLRSGRELTTQEVARGEHYALINETAAKLWPAGESPIGKRIRLTSLERNDPRLLKPSSPSGWVTIVGVLGDTRNSGIRNPVSPAAYVPYTLVAPLDRIIAIRTQGDPMQMLNVVRQRVQAIDKELPLGRPITLEEVVGFQSVQPRFNMALFTFFGAMGLTLAAFGIYSVLSYTVTQKTHEIGIRMALGAGRGQVLGQMLAMGGRLVGIGLVIGLVTGVALARWAKSAVFEVPETDPLAIAGVIVVIALTALVACLLPAKRAATLDPMAALRHE